MVGVSTLCAAGVQSTRQGFFYSDESLCVRQDLGGTITDDARDHGRSTGTLGSVCHVGRVDNHMVFGQRVVSLLSRDTGTHARMHTPFGTLYIALCVCSILVSVG